MTPEFRPVLYVKTGCPSCFKARLFLLEAGLIDRFNLREFAAGDASDGPIKAELAPHFTQVTFPTVQDTEGCFRNESDDIVAHYAHAAGVDPLGLPLFQAYVRNILPRLRVLSRENKDLKARLAGSADLRASAGS